MIMVKANLLFLFLVVIFSQHIHRTLSIEFSSDPYDAIYNFGDSISDTGNRLLYGGSMANTGQPPYGMTFFNKPTGRYCDGRLIVDFLAEAFELPYLVPSLTLTGLTGETNQIGVNFSGASFAIGGATALNKNYSGEGTLNGSLPVQLNWFKQLKPYLCAPEQDCRRFFKKSLFIVGEIGGNDYNFAFSERKSMEEVQAVVSPVVEAISDAITTLINEGATHLVVPGNFPLGCSPIYLTMFESQNKTDYDSFGCLKDFNAFSEFHNSNLKRSLKTLQRRNRHVRIVYADYYGATMQYIKAPRHNGLLRHTLLKACCGGGGKYNYNSLAMCGLSEESSVCKDPSSYQSWDGMHFTEAAYRVIADGLLYRGFTSPPLVPRTSPLISGLVARE